MCIAGYESGGFEHAYDARDCPFLSRKSSAASLWWIVDTTRIHIANAARLLKQNYLSIRCVRHRHRHIVHHPSVYAWRVWVLTMWARGVCLLVAIYTYTHTAAVSGWMGYVRHGNRHTFEYKANERLLSYLIPHNYFKIQFSNLKARRRGNGYTS